MKRPTSQLTLVAPSRHQSVGLAKACATFTRKALKAFARAYFEAAWHNAYWIGCPAALVKKGPGVSSVRLVLPGQGRLVKALGLTHKVTAQDLNGQAAILEGLIEPKTLIPPHTHTREDECTYVLSGDLMFDIGGEVMEVPTGSYVVKPRGVYHAFWNPGPAPARVIEFHVPGAFDSFYDEIGEVLGGSYDTETERQAAQAAVMDRYGETFHWERIPEYVQKYGAHP
jgi:quercetin dioxygenase-like cupin family protein